MELLLVLLVVGAIGYAVIRARREREAAVAAADRLQFVRRAANEDVTRFGEELQDLHIDTLTTELDAPMRQDYQRALDAYENAKQLLVEMRTAEDITHVTRTLEDGRYAQACVLARQAGEPLPQRRPPCFFNPVHGPAQTDVEWAPPGGVPREVPVCLADADRLSQGAEPDVRQVRVGNRMVPWYQGGPAYASYADGYYGSYAMQGLFPTIIIASMMASSWGTQEIGSGEGGSGDGDWSGGDSGGGWGEGSGDGGGGSWGGDSGGGGWGGGWSGDGGGGWGGDGGGGF